MLLHLINTTAIWLLSLLVFDIFFRKESYHSYNRAYLLITLFIGIVLPFWHWEDPSIINAAGMDIPVTRTATIRQNIVTYTATTQSSYSWLQWLSIIYLIGVCVMLFLLVREVVNILRLYRHGILSKDGVWNIVETNKEHSPFSAFRYVFISNKKNYTEQQLRIILTHEEQHGHALHFIDLTLMQLAKAFLWFHPLVYIYNSRLLMVHEYQADAAVDNVPHEYGLFLIEQALLPAPPSLSHSFNRSPVKKRIVMLTLKSSFAAGFKRLFAIPLCIVCLFFFTENAISKESRKEGGKLYYKGNVFELWSPNPNPDTIMVQNPETGEMQLRISRIDSFPVAMNGKEIFRVDELSRLEKEEFNKTTGEEIKTYFLNKMMPVINKMPDGNYKINGYVILDTKGEIVYISDINIADCDWKNNYTDSYTALVKSLENELTKIVENTGHRFTPVKRAGKAEVVRLEEYFHYITFHVKNHEVTYTTQ